MRTLALALMLAAQLLLLSFAASPAHAQAPAPGVGSSSAPAPEAPADPNQLVPPKLLAFVDAGYPDQALEANAPAAAVLLVITIGDDGFVEDVGLAGEPVGFGFDEAAVSAARRFVFDPARRGDVPMRSRIQYRYQFNLPAPPAAATAQPGAAPAQTAAVATGGLDLRVREADEGKPLAEAEIIVSLVADANTTFRLVTDAEGFAKKSDLTPGTYEVRVTKKDFGDEVHTEEVLANQVTELTYRLSELRNYEEYGAIARVKAPPREVTRRTIEREELTRVAGTRGDALRTIELLPGVSRPPFGSGQVLIRGSSPQDSQVLLDGVPVPLLYHFGGLTSFINSRALERIDFYPGNFSVKYGRRVGGIIDVGTREPATDRIRGVLDVNVPLDSSLLLEGPITDKLSIMVGGRRSYFGEIVSNTIPKDTFDAFAAPVYNDYQVFINYRPTDRDKLRFSAYGTSDRLEVLFSDAPDGEPTIRGIELGLYFHRQQVGWAHQYNTKLDHNIEASFGRIVQNFTAGPELFLNIQNNNNYVRGEWRYRVNNAVQVTWGTDTSITAYDVKFNGPPPGDDEGNAGGGGGPSDNEVVRFKQTGWDYQPSLYLELALKPTDKLRVIPGMRIDYAGRNSRFTYDPRVAAIYSIRDDWRIKAGVGVFSQRPRDQETAKGIGNPDLLSMQALHYGGGFEHDFTDELSITVEGFYKRLYRRVVATDAVQGSEEPPFDNDGKGRIYGLEVMGRKKAKGRWFGFLSYTLMRSERKDPGQPWRLFDYDQTHIFNLASTVRLGKNWELGGTLRIVTGNPYTPYTNTAVYNSTTGAYFPEYGRINSARAPTFNRLDVRLEKSWIFKSWRLAWYLDVQNIYNAKNPETRVYSFDYSQQQYIRGLPIIPITGLRGEL